MRPAKPQDLHSPVITEPFQTRVDLACQSAVDQALLVQASFNSVCAIEYLKAHDVDARVIERVLLHPGQRRKRPH